MLCQLVVYTINCRGACAFRQDWNVQWILHISSYQTSWSLEGIVFCVHQQELIKEQLIYLYELLLQKIKSNTLCCYFLFTDEFLFLEDDIPAYQALSVFDGFLVAKDSSILHILSYQHFGTLLKNALIFNCNEQYINKKKI